MTRNDIAAPKAPYLCDKPVARNKAARVAGLLYLLVVLIAPYRLIYVPTMLFVDGNAATTIANIAAHETLFRFGLAADLACGALQAFMVLALFRLLGEVDRRHGIAMLLLGGALVPALYFFNVLNDAAVLLLVHGSDAFAAFEPVQRTALAMLFLHMHGQTIGVAETLWGLWLLPLALLVVRSGFLPRLFGYGLILNGAAYVIQSLAWALSPDWQDRLSGVLGPLQFVEVLFMLWLLVLGARPGFRSAQVAPRHADGGVNTLSIIHRIQGFALNTTTKQPLEHWRVPVQLKLAALWTSVMFCYIYNDYFSMYVPGTLKSMLDGPATQGMLLGYMGMTVGACLMPVFSLLLKPVLSRWFNIVLGLAYTAILIFLMPGTWLFYQALTGVEVVLQLLAVWYAWRWPRALATACYVAQQEHV